MGLLLSKALLQECAGTWRKRTLSNKGSDLIGLHEQQGRALLQLLTHYPWIVYLGYSFWRKLLVMLHDHGALLKPLGSDNPDPYQQSNVARLAAADRPPLLCKDKVVGIKNPQLLRLAAHLGTSGSLDKFTRSAHLMSQGFLKKRRPLTEDASSAQYWKLFQHFFHHLLLNNQIDVVKIAVKELGLDLKHKWCDNEAALQIATKHHLTMLVTTLIDQGAPLEGKDFKNTTVLHKAAGMGHRKLVEVLLARGINVNSVNEYGTTPLQRAAQSGQWQVVQFLIKEGAKVNAVNKLNITALQWAAAMGHQKVVEALIDSGADVDVEDAYGGNALSKAICNDHHKVILILKGHGGVLPGKPPKKNK